MPLLQEDGTHRKCVPFKENNPSTRVHKLQVDGSKNEAYTLFNITGIEALHLQLEQK